MRWVTGVVRGNAGRFRLCVQTDPGKIALEEISDWKGDNQPLGKLPPKTLKIDFDDFRRVGLRSYVEGLGKSWLGTKGQTGFAAKTPTAACDEAAPLRSTTPRNRPSLARAFAMFPG